MIGKPWRSWRPWRLYSRNVATVGGTAMDAKVRKGRLNSDEWVVLSALGGLGG
ncbi:MAG: hypothetical protein R6V27_06060 [Balneolaceae bacterium]